MNWLMFKWLRWMYGPALRGMADEMYNDLDGCNFKAHSCFSLRVCCRHAGFNTFSVDVIHTRYYKLAKSMGLVRKGYAKNEQFLVGQASGRTETFRRDLVGAFVDECYR